MNTPENRPENTLGTSNADTSSVDASRAAANADSSVSLGGAQGGAPSTSGVSLIEALPQHRFDELPLWRYLQEHLPDFALPASLKQFQGGQSNPTFLIETPQAKFVLRKKPPGKLLPSAHLIEREYRILRALPARDIPLPRARLSCEDPSIIGTAFYVMDHVDGRISASVGLPHMSPTERGAVYSDFARTAAKLHSVDFRACGLGDFGKPEGYVSRQLDRWTRQYQASKTVESPEMDQLIGWLGAHQPQQDETAIAHGDFRIGNMILHPTEPRIIAVLDWELATLGHPLSDLAYACMFYHMAPQSDAGGGLAGLDLSTLGIPSESQFLDLYCRYSGRQEITDWPFFLGFSCFRMSAITQGVYARALQGNAADQRAIRYGETAKMFARLGWQLVQRRK